MCMHFVLLKTHFFDLVYFFNIYSLQRVFIWVIQYGFMPKRHKIRVERKVVRPRRQCPKHPNSVTFWVSIDLNKKSSWTFYWVIESIKTIDKSPTRMGATSWKFEPMAAQIVVPFVYRYFLHPRITLFEREERVTLSPTFLFGVSGDTKAMGFPRLFYIPYMRSKSKKIYYTLLYWVRLPASVLQAARRRINQQH